MKAIGGLFDLIPRHENLANAPGRKRLRRSCRSLEKRLVREDREPSQTESDSLRSQFVHAAGADDVGWRRTLCQDLNEIWERQGLATGQPGRLMEQHGQELPLRHPQQERSRQPQQESGLPALLVLRHGGAVSPPDDAFSSAPSPGDGDKSTVRLPSSANISPRMERKTDGGEGPGELF